MALLWLDQVGRTLVESDVWGGGSGLGRRRNNPSFTGTDLLLEWVSREAATLEGVQVIARIIIQADDEHSANVARVISGWIEQQLYRLNDQVEEIRR